VIFKDLSPLALALLAVVSLLATTASARTLSVVGLGDSLMAAYNLEKAEGFPAKLEAALRQQGFDVTIADAGVSGDTSTGGLARLDWSVPDGTDAVILELGANDALRGISPEKTRENLEAMISRLKERGIAVLLVGMLAPPNMGEAYEAAFNAIYPKLAEKHGLTLYPFFLDGVTTFPQFQLEDGMHPNAAGIEVMVERFAPVAARFLTELSASMEPAN
jgi:Lysophospholipase L1 and related esterases